jgi:hypothetical protein
MRIRNLMLAGVMGWCPNPAEAQHTTGYLVGRVIDKQGKPVPNARVDVSSPALLQARTLRTNADGVWRGWLLPPGTYSVLITAGGYVTARIDNLQVRVSKTYRFVPMATADIPIYTVKTVP